MNADKQKLLYSDLTQKIIEAFYLVYNELGAGFLESVYRRALLISLREAGLQVEQEVSIAVWFHGENVGDFRADLLVEGKVLLELKTAYTIDRSHEAQLLNYLRATPIEVGLILNFGPRAQFRRLAFSNEKKEIRVHPRSSAVGSC
jgi:GxxExxY protein